MLEEREEKEFEWNFLFLLCFNTVENIKIPLSTAYIVFAIHKGKEVHCIWSTMAEYQSKESVIKNLT